MTIHGYHFGISTKKDGLFANWILLKQPQIIASEFEHITQTEEKSQEMLFNLVFSLELLIKNNLAVIVVNSNLWP